jgi:hypothetical protein
VVLQLEYPLRVIAGRRTTTQERGWNAMSRGYQKDWRKRGEGLLACVSMLWSETLNDQTNERIGSSIRNKRPVQRHAEVEMDTRKDNWASKFHESHNRVGRGHRWRGGCEGVECPTTRNEKARTRPHSYSVFHATAPTVLAQIIPPILPNCKRQIDQLGSGHVAVTGHGVDLTGWSHTAQCFGSVSRRSDASV